MIFPRKRLIKPRLGARIQRGHPRARGLVFFPLMNEGTGDKVFDASGNGINGVFSGDVTWVSGKYGSALNFPGSDDWVDLAGLTPYASTQPHTYIAWVRPTSLAVYNWVISNDKTDTTNGDSMVIRSTGTIGYFYKGGQLVINSVGTISTNVWTQIALVYNSESVDFYINGVYDSTVAAPGVYTAGNTNPRIGAWGNGAWDFTGAIDLPMIYNRALSAQEIQQPYIDPFGMFERDDIALWQLGIEPSVYDSIFMGCNF